MNVTLYGRTFNFHKVVQQQNSGAMEDYILPYSAVYLRIQKWKNYWNRSTFAKVIVKIKVAPFLMSHGVLYILCFTPHSLAEELFSAVSHVSHNILQCMLKLCPAPILAYVAYPIQRIGWGNHINVKRRFYVFFLFLNKNAFFISPTFFIKNES